MGYEVLGLLGRGGTAVVELAVDSEGRLVARKRVPLTGSAAEIEVARRRLRREAETLSGLQHPGVLPLLAVEDDGTDVVLVMPAMAGSLADRVRTEGVPSAAELVRVGRDLLDALASAHRSGIVHRDIKPSNVLFDGRGKVYLADFGVAVTRELTEGLTAPGSVVGTAAFMAPEQARGDAPAPASDVFSLAATLLFTLSGEGPYGVGDADLLMRRAARGRVQPLPAGVPSELRRPLKAMLDPRPERRPSAAAVLGGLTGTAAHPVARVRRATRRSGGRWRLPLIVGIAVALGVSSVAALELRGGPARTSEQEATGGVAAACAPLPYQPCDRPQPAPHTDGRACLPGWYDLDGIRTNGCEATSDYVAGSELVAGRPLHANLVPSTASDTYRTWVHGDVFDLGWGRLTVSLQAPKGVTDEIQVVHGGTVLAQAQSRDGHQATATVAKPSWLGANSEWLTVRVTPVSGVSAADFVISRNGGW